MTKKTIVSVQWYRKAADVAEKSALLLDTLTATDTLAALAGAAHTSRLALTNVAATGEVPNRHDNSGRGRKFVPVSVTGVPPVAGPRVGDSVDTVGCAEHNADRQKQGHTIIEVPDNTVNVCIQNVQHNTANKRHIVKEHTP